MLLVLDNYEHVIEAAAALAVDTLRGRRACGFWRVKFSDIQGRARFWVFGALAPPSVWLSMLMFVFEVLVHQKGKDSAWQDIKQLADD
jgi:hypothetical protein